MSVLRVLVVRGVVVAVRTVVVVVRIVVVAKLCSHTALTHFGPNSRTAKRPIKEKTGTCPEQGEGSEGADCLTHTHTPIHTLVWKGGTVSVTRRSTEQLFCCAFSARSAFELTAFDIALTPTGDASQLVSHNNNKGKEAASDRDREGEGDREMKRVRQHEDTRCGATPAHFVTQFAARNFHYVNLYPSPFFPLFPFPRVTCDSHKSQAPNAAQKPE